MATRTISNAGGLWSATTTWVEGIVPTSADDVRATSTSGNVTVASDAPCRSIDLTNVGGGAGDYAGTLAINNATAIAVGHSTAPPSNIALRYPSSMTLQLNNPVSAGHYFVHTHTGVVDIDWGGKTVASITINSTGVVGAARCRLISSMTTLATGGVGLVTGELDTNGQACSWGFFGSTNTGVVRTLILGSSAITITGSQATPWNIVVSGGSFTLNAGTSHINLTNAAAVTFEGAGKSYYDVTFSGSLGVAARINGANSFRNLTRTAVGALTTTAPSSLELGANQTVTGTFTATGGARNARIYVNAAAWYITQRTITAAAVSLTNVDFMSIVGAGATTWTGTSIGDCLNNSGITFTAPKTVYFMVASGSGNYSNGNSWAATSGGAVSVNNFPLPQDTARFDGNSFTATGQTVNINYWAICSIDFTGVTNNPTLNPNYNFAFQFGDITFSIGMTHHLVTGAIWVPTGGNITLAGRTTLIGPWPVVGPGKSVKLMDSGGSVIQVQTLGSGFDHPTAVSSFDFNGQTLSSGLVNLGSGSKVNMAGCTVNLTGTDTIWDTLVTPTGLSTSTINITDTSASQKHFQGRGLNYGTFNISAGGTGPVNIWYSNTFVNLTIAGPKTVALNAAGGTQTVTGQITLNASSGNVITLQSSTAGSTANLFKAAGRVDGNFLSLKDITASGGASFYAGPNSTVVSNVTGWRYHHAPQMMLSMFYD